MKFCSHCGAPVRFFVPAGDTLPRHVCTGCASIHYLNPKIVVGCIVEQAGRILLCRRAIEPRYGRWTFPAGFMENEETTAEGAARETLEEACAEVEIGDLFALVNVPHIHQVHVFYRGALRRGGYGAGSESLECRMFDEAEVPWEDLAFRTISLTLAAYFADRRDGRWRVHSFDLGMPG